uniref:Cyclin dependent kinase 2 interacting protein n=1 Tax=Capra hircus TaxID=9925 RepID=A0A8C2PKT2_CAPHI
MGGASGLFPGVPAEGMEAKTLGTVTPRKPVLSVSARKIKDNAADWHNLILKWETLNDGGFATANSIANMKISLLSKDKIELVSSGLASDDCAEKEHPEYSRELETLCEQLQATLEGLTKIQMKMEKLSSTTKGVCELEDYHHGEERKRPPLFHTWPTARFSTCPCGCTSPTWRAAAGCFWRACCWKRGTAHCDLPPHLGAPDPPVDRLPALWGLSRH